MFGLSIRTFLLAIFGLMVAFVIGFGAFSLAKIAAVNASTVDIATNWLPAISALRDIEYQSSRYRAGEGRHILADEAAVKEGVERDVARRADNIAKLRKTYEPLISSPEERAAYESFVQHWEAFLKVHETVFALSREKRVAEASALFGTEIVKTYNLVETDLQKLVDLNTAGAAAATENAAANYQATRFATFVFVAIAAMVAIGAMVFVLVGIARPLLALVASMKRLGDGDFSVVLPGLGRRDEIGAMAEAVEHFKIKSEEKAQQEVEAKAQQDRAAAAERKAEIQKIAEDFEQAVGDIINTVFSASTTLETSATGLTKTAETTQQLSTVVAAASEEASTNVQSVASAAEELIASVAEIGRQVHESSRISGEAVNQAQMTDERITKLAQAANRIGDVTQLITSIAEQTNLLALNATIEAARAGVAGKGFAVVASEVKQLASQTAKATSEISTQIAEMQAATHESVAAIKEIGGTIGRISEIATTIASAVEEQGAATQEITRNVQQAAAGTTEVASSITNVSRGAAETGTASAEVLTSAKSLAGESNRLKLEMIKFLGTIRAA